MSIESKAEMALEKAMLGGTALIEGAKAPLFDLSDQDGNTHKLSDYLGKFVVLYFYPKDATPGCTTEACAFRDTIQDYRKRGVAVLGVSGDSVDSHAKFAKDQKLNFPILSDPGYAVCKKYGVYGEKRFMGRAFMGIRRTTFVIGKDGLIAKAFPEVDVKIHAMQVLQAIAGLGG